MQSTFTRHALQYQVPFSKAEAIQTLRKIKRIVICIFVCLCCSNIMAKNVFANNELILNAIPPMTVFYGKPFVYQFASPSIEPEFLRIRLINKPRNAALVTNAEGLPVFTWTPPLNVLPSTVVIVQAFDARDKNKISTQRMVLQKGPYSPNAIEPVAESGLGAPVLVERIMPVPQPEPIAQTEPSELPDEASAAASTSGVARAFVDELASESTQSIPQKTVQLTSNQAPQLPELGTQLLTVGVEFQLFIRPIDKDGDAVSLSVKGLPMMAELRNITTGSWMLRWRPEASQAGEHRLMLIAVENTAAALQTERVLTLNVGDPNAQTRLVLASANLSNNDFNSTETRAGDSAANGLAGKRNNITFEPLSSQIVSTGQTINLPIISRVGENSKTILHVDRLPSGATFDLNEDGTRTFHWVTSASDQGEHVFRFTAVNPRDANQVLNKELLIVVGDPAAPGSMPQ